MKKVALVTGGTRGIGAAVSRNLREAGYNVVAIYNGNDKAAHAFQKNSSILTYKWDVGDFKACQEGVAQVTKEYGPIDVLVNNAGILTANNKWWWQNK